MKKNVFSLMAMILFSIPAVIADDAAIEQTTNPIVTGVPSLSITPDTRSGGMGDIGAATTPDINSQHWNASKYAFMDSHGGLSISYTPWLRKLVSDIDLAYISGYYKFDDVQAISSSFRYFSLGDIMLTDYEGNNITNAKPYELCVDAAYSRKLAENFSMAVAFRFIYSDLNNGVNVSTSGAEEMYPGWALAADISAYYHQPITLGSGDADLAFGLNISNLGSKISYDQRQTSNFLPANLRLGGSFDIPIDNYNRISVNADINKLLVPTRQSKFAPVNETTGKQVTGTELTEWYSSISSMKGLWMSFADAPGGFKEELQELQWGAGIEYAYNRQFFARVGYSNESKMKGGRKFFTVGAGFKLTIFQLDAAYVIAVAQNSPLDQTLRFSLSFDLYGIKDLLK